VRAGAQVVAIIPVRGGNGEIERLQSLGAFTPPTLMQLEAALDAALPQHGAVVTADLWDAERLPCCAACRSARLRRLHQINLSQTPVPRIDCPTCG
jgi:hypothetical protein